MISIGVKQYIKKKAKKFGIQLTEDYLKILKYYCALVRKEGCSLSFRKGRNLNPNTLDCNAGLGIIFGIVATPEWAYQLVVDTQDSLQNIFLMTLGHELTHRENDLNPLLHFGKNQKFVAYINEVHADFGAVVKFGDCDSDKQIQAMNYKLIEKEKSGRKDESNNGHPSWEKRMSYIQQKNFDEALIRRIAADVRCTNEKLIQKVISHFDEIYLN